MSLLFAHSRTHKPVNENIHEELASSVDKLVNIFLNVVTRRLSPKKMEMPENRAEKLTESLTVLTAKFNSGHFKYMVNENRLPVPYIMDILSLFGSWLFANSVTEGKEYAMGTAISLGCLCKIFSKFPGEIPNEILSKFCFVVLRTIKKHQINHPALSLMLRNSQDLLTRGYSFFKCILIPDGLITGIKKLLDEYSLSLLDKQAAYTILSQVCMLAPHYLINSSSRWIVAWKSTNMMAAEILSKALLYEADEFSMTILTNAAVAYLYACPEEANISLLVGSMLSRLDGVTN